jgi:hypothetical protein
VLKADADEEGIGADDYADCLRCLVATKLRTVTERKPRGLCVAEVHTADDVRRVNKEVSTGEAIVALNTDKVFRT